MLRGWKSTLFSGFLDFDKACLQIPDARIERKTRIKELLPPGSSGLAGKEILGGLMRMRKCKVSDLEK